MQTLPSPVSVFARSQFPPLFFHSPCFYLLISLPSSRPCPCLPPCPCPSLYLSPFLTLVLALPLPLPQSCLLFSITSQSLRSILTGILTPWHIYLFHPSPAHPSRNTMHPGRPWYLHVKLQNTIQRILLAVPTAEAARRVHCNIEAQPIAAFG